MNCRFGRTIARRGAPSRCKRKPGPKTGSGGGMGGFLSSIFGKRTPRPYNKAAPNNQPGMQYINPYIIQTYSRDIPIPKVKPRHYVNWVQK